MDDSAEESSIGHISEPTTSAEGNTLNELWVVNRLNSEIPIEKESFTKKIIELESSNKEITHQNNLLSLRIKELEEELSLRDREICELRVKTSDKDMAHTRQLRKEKDRLVHTLQEKTKETARLNEELDKINNENSMITKEVLEYEKKLQERCRTIDNLQRTVSQLESQLQQAERSKKESSQHALVGSSEVVDPQPTPQSTSISTTKPSQTSSYNNAVTSTASNISSRARELVSKGGDGAGGSAAASRNGEAGRTMAAVFPPSSATENILMSTASVRSSNQNTAVTSTPASNMRKLRTLTEEGDDPGHLSTNLDLGSEYLTSPFSSESYETISTTTPCNTSSFNDALLTSASASFSNSNDTAYEQAGREVRTRGNEIYPRSRESVTNVFQTSSTSEGYTRPPDVTAPVNQTTPIAVPSRSSQFSRAMYQEAQDPEFLLTRSPPPYEPFTRTEIIECPFYCGEKGDAPAIQHHINTMHL